MSLFLILSSPHRVLGSFSDPQNEFYEIMDPMEAFMVDLDEETEYTKIMK